MNLALVAQVFNLLYRRLPVGWALEWRGASGLVVPSADPPRRKIRDTADWKSALRRGRVSRLRRRYTVRRVLRE